jgi:hypothetical protein
MRRAAKVGSDHPSAVGSRQSAVGRNALPTAHWLEAQVHQIKEMGYERYLTMQIAGPKD